MELPFIEYEESEYYETDTGNKVSKSANILGSHNILLAGKTIIQESCMIRGDLRREGAQNNTSFIIGRYCLFAKNTLFKPPYKIFKGLFSYFPMKIGDYVHVDENSIVEAASIGNCVRIGKNCVIGRFAIIKDGVVIKDDTVIPPNTVIPSFTLVSGCPPKQVIEPLSENVPENLESKAKSYYMKFIPK
ncbi:hypothetical protein BB560_000515 [Smittium megazygosporum]|uniref:Dynactin subunit 5 n=1 Tax=Smittium megazygosporum TaxID=133381 RepID=A0A2T9ZK43_9FUNG|nr:hypothetical protein BB560_000515 [Smittium megazygosporum]